MLATSNSTLPAERFPKSSVTTTMRPGDGTIIRYYLLPPSTAAAPLPTGTSSLSWTAGNLVRFDGVLVPHRLQPGQTVQVQLSMTVVQQPAAGAPDFSVFVHLLDATGNAEAAFIPLALVKPGEGNYIEVNDGLHRPIDQALGIINASPKQAGARRFVDFLLSQQGQDLLSQKGYNKRPPQ